MTIIYALLDPTNGEARYVGKTEATLNLRLRQHIRTALRGSRRYCVPKGTGRRAA